MYKKLNPKSNLARKLITQYNNSKYYSLSYCYNRCSRSKEVSEMYIEDEQSQYNGYDYRILSYNRNMFTAGFRYNTLEGIILRVYTHLHIYEISL